MDSNYSPEFNARPMSSSTFHTPTGSTVSIGDIYFILFRHKWKIVVLSLLGFAGAYALITLFPREYSSQARLFIRYVQEDNKPGPGGDGAIRSLGSRGENILAGEIAIVQSLDLAQKAADLYGPEKILDPKSESTNPRLAAASQVYGGLSIEVPKNSSVLELTFTHKKAEIVQPVLATIIDIYLKRHMEIHRPGASFDDAFVTQTEQLKAKLAQTEADLQRERTKAGIISLEDAKKHFGQKINDLRDGIMVAEASIAEGQAMLKRLGESGVLNAAPESTTPSPANTENLPLAAYQSAVERFNLLRTRERELSLVFTAESPRLRDVTAEAKAAEAKKIELEKAYPGLLKVTQISTTSPRSPSSNQTIDPVVENARIAALATRIEILKLQLEQVRQEAANVDRAELVIQELERRKTIEETNYRYFAATLEQTRINEALGAGRVTNISPVQNPSPPAPVRNKSTRFAAVAALGGIALGIAWAFVIELFLDRTIKRASDFRSIPGINLFLTIPRQRARRKLRGGPSNQPQLGAGTSTEGGERKSSDTHEIAPWDPEQGMHVYFDTLRDRVIGFFESENLTHKPKLIALAGVGNKGSDSDVAAGLASSFSETEAGNVLFVDMTTGQGSTQQFMQGKAVNNIDDALSSKEKAQVHDKLFVVSEIGKGDKLPRALPMRFNHIIPKLKASDFDYIIFNMPPVSPISITPRLAGYMDVVLLVVDSDKVNRDLVAQARDLLAESKTPVGAVLANTHNPVPKFLAQETVS